MLVISGWFAQLHQALCSPHNFLKQLSHTVLLHLAATINILCMFMGLEEEEGTENGLSFSLKKVRIKLQYVISWNDHILEYSTSLMEHISISAFWDIQKTLSARGFFSTIRKRLLQLSMEEHSPIAKAMISFSSFLRWKKEGSYLYGSVEKWWLTFVIILRFLFPLSPASRWWVTLYSRPAEVCSVNRPPPRRRFEKNLKKNKPNSNNFNQPAESKSGRVFQEAEMRS